MYLITSRHYFNDTILHDVIRENFDSLKHIVFTSDRNYNFEFHLDVSYCKVPEQIELP